MNYFNLSTLKIKYYLIMNYRIKEWDGIQLYYIKKLKFYYLN